jgi:4-hydroxy-tetrahydrodipicolinate synthase
MTKSLSGVLSALVTPFAEDGRVDEKQLRAVVDRSVEGGLDAVVAGGGTGEVASLDDDERTQLFEVVVDQTAGRVPVVANIGSLTAPRAIRLGRAAERAGADVVMLITPYYEQLSHDETARFIRQVAAGVELPIMLYNNPSVTGTNLDAATLAAFGREIDNVQYVKDSSKDWEQALRLIHHHSDDIGLIVGWDSFIFSALLEGATGIMAGAANVVPHEIAAVASALRAGDVEGARALWLPLFPVIDVLLELPFVQAVKAGMQLRGVPVGSPREPLLDLSPDGFARLEAAIAQLPT